MSGTSAVANIGTIGGTGSTIGDITVSGDGAFTMTAGAALSVGAIDTSAVNAGNEVIVLDGATYATAALAEAALDTYAGAVITATDDVVFIYSDGTNAYVYKDVNAGTLTGAGADLTLIATLIGITSVAIMVVGNFGTFA